MFPRCSVSIFRSNKQVTAMNRTIHPAPRPHHTPQPRQPVTLTTVRSTLDGLCDVMEAVFLLVGAVLQALNHMLEGSGMLPPVVSEFKHLSQYSWGCSSVEKKF